MNKKGKIVWVLEKVLLADLCLFVLLCPFFARVPKITAAIGFILWITINAVKYGREFYKNLIPKNSLNKPLLFFVIALIFSVLFSLDPYHSQSILFERYIYYFFFFIIGSYLGQNKKNLFFLAAAIILTGIIVGIGGVWDLIRFNPQRLFTFYGKKVILAPFLALLIPFSFTIAVFLKNKTLRISAALSFLLFLPVLLFNASRAAWGAVLFIILIISFLKSKKIAVFLLIAFLITGLFFLPNHFQKRASTTFVPDKWGDRVVMWKSTINIFQDFPIFGAGLGTTENILYKYQPPEGCKVQGHLHAHNTYLELLAEAGVVGLIVFLSLFVIYFKGFFKFYEKKLDNKVKVINLAFLSSILSGLILSLAGTLFIVGLQDASLFWFFFGLSVGLISKNKIIKEDK